MQDDPVRLDPDQLLREMGWMRGLARHLVGNAEGADELVQQACMTALEQPEGVAHPRSWLAGVLRNLASQERRRAQRRRRREQGGARDERTDSTTELVERLATQRSLSDALLALEEPYRSVVLLRYFENLPPRKIAARLGLPVETVKTRLKRALERLRLRLDRQFGGEREAWLMALLPLCTARSTPLSLTVGGALLVNTKVKLALGAVGLLSALAAWSLVSDDSAPKEALGEPDPAPAELEAAVAREPAEAEPQRARLNEPALTAETEVAAAPSVRRLRGRALRVDGSPFAGLKLHFHSTQAEIDEPETITAEDGSFEFPWPEVNGRILDAVDGYATVLEGVHSAKELGIEPIVVVAPAVDLAGRIRDPLGTPLVGARVQAVLPADFRARFREVMDRSKRVSWVDLSDAQGGFSLTDVPAIPDAALRVDLEGYESLNRACPNFRDLGLDLVLEPVQPAADALRGQVIGPQGERIAFARVSHGSRNVVTDADGRFHFEWNDEDAEQPLIAIAQGFQPGEFEAPPMLATDDRPAWPSFALVRLGAAPLTIRGQVQDGLGQPIAGIKVWVEDTTHFGMVDQLPARLECLMAGAVSISDKDRLQTEGVDADEAHRPSLFWNWVHTDEEGRFELRGLLPRNYSLRALDRESSAQGRLKSVPAGSEGVVLRIPTEDVLTDVRGQVVSRQGTPVAGAKVTVKALAISVLVQNHSSTIAESGEETVTDEDGWFLLRRVPKRHAYLRVQGDEILPREFGRDHPDGLGAMLAEQPDGIRIEVSRRCHFQVDLSHSEIEAQFLQVLDRDGNPLSISQFSGTGRYSSSTIPLHGGKSEVLSVADHAEELVLLGADLQARKRLPIRLLAGEVLRITP